MLLANNWNDYKILDAGSGLKIELIKDYTIIRPDSQIIWDKFNPEIWKKVDAIYHRSKEGGGYWQFNRKIDSRFFINYKALKFNIELTSFKHIGLFPEQAANWDFIIDKISSESKKREIKVLNLFAYTGGATVASVYANAHETVHVDSSKRIVGTAKKNIELNNLQSKTVRYIIEDATKFVMREIRRERKYDVIIMDPPVYGRGPDGELWQIETSLVDLVRKCSELMSSNPILMLINSYTSSFSNVALKNMMEGILTPKHKGRVESGEIGIPIENSDSALPCGIFSRWYKA